jgi:hypothetical protein
MNWYDLVIKAKQVEAVATNPLFLWFPWMMPEAEVTFLLLANKIDLESSK